MASNDLEHREEEENVAGKDEDRGTQVALIVRLEAVAVTTGLLSATDLSCSPNEDLKVQVAYQGVLVHIVKPMHLKHIQSVRLSHATSLKLHSRQLSFGWWRK